MPSKKRARRKLPPAKAGTALMPEKLAPLVLFVRGEKVLLDTDLAALYGVEIRTLNQAVRRNLERFPEDFVFQLTDEDMEDLKSQFVTAKDHPSALRSQFVTLKRGQHRKYLPYAFTEQGVAMLSSVLRSPRAVDVNIAIMRTFVQLRRLMDSNELLAKKIASLERKYSDHDKQFAIIFEAIKALIAEDKKPSREIGFHAVPGSDGG